MRTLTGTAEAVVRGVRRRLIGWGQRRTAQHRLKTTVALFYHPDYNPHGRARTARVPNLDLGRSERVLGLLSAERLLPDHAIRPSPIASIEQLRTVHTDAYLERIAIPEHLAEIFALNASEVDVDAIQMAQRRAVGGTIAAAHWSQKRPSRVAVNLGGGLHHAGPDTGTGFCVFNDIAIAIRSLRKDGFDAPIAVVDLDFHQGDGTLVTFADDPTVLTYSIHGSTWTHVEAVADHQFVLGEGTTDEDYLRELHRTLPDLLRDHDPRLVFYVAGNDVLAGDALGSFALTLAGALKRDRFVVEMVRALGASAVVTLGGGYSDNAWRATSNFVRWLLCDDSEGPSRGLVDRDIRARFDRIARDLQPSSLQWDPDSLDLDESDLFAELTGKAGSRRLLGYYSKAGVEFALEQYGLLQGLRDKGFSNLQLEIDPSDSSAQVVTIDGYKHGKRHRLVELVVRLESVPPPAGLSHGLDFLSIEWLLLQDPSETFSLRRPPLPGQQHPGLGMVREVVEMLYQACRRLHLDGLVVHPSHYHVAATADRFFQFLDPAVQGRFDGMHELLRDRDLATASALVDDLAVRDASDRPIPWTATDFVAPMSDRLRDYLASPPYRDQRQRARATVSHLALVTGTTESP